MFLYNKRCYVYFLIVNQNAFTGLSSVIEVHTAFLISNSLHQPPWCQVLEMQMQAVLLLETNTGT